MQFVITVFLILASTPSWALDDHLILSLVVKRKYVKETTEVFSLGKQWFCKTEMNPYFVSNKKPFEDKAFQELQLRTTELKSAMPVCHEQAVLSKKEANSRTIISGCLSDGKLRDFIEKIGVSCGR